MTSTLHNPIFKLLDLTTFAGLDPLGLTAIGQHLGAAKAEILCQVTRQRVQREQHGR